jgi:hypothetical protein
MNNATFPYKMEKKDPTSKKYLWLKDIGLFEIVPNPGEGNCLFHAIAQGLNYWADGDDDSSPHHSHSSVRLSIVKYLTSKRGSHLWSQFLPEMMHFWNISPKIPFPFYGESDVNPQNFKDHYIHLMGQESEPGTLYELTGAGSLFGFHFDYLDMVHSENDATKTAATNSDGTRFHLNMGRSLTPTHSSPFQCREHSYSGTDADDSDANGTRNEEDLFIRTREEDEKESDRQVVCQGRMYQFYGCRNNGCNVPRVKPSSENVSETSQTFAVSSSSVEHERVAAVGNGDTNADNNATTVDFAFSSINTRIWTGHTVAVGTDADDGGGQLKKDITFETRHLYLLHTRYSMFEGHWELLRPVWLRLECMWSFLR